MDIKAKIEELGKMHDEQESILNQSAKAADNARVNMIKIEGALEILREQLAEPELARAAGGD